MIAVACAVQQVEHRIPRRVRPVAGGCVDVHPPDRPQSAGVVRDGGNVAVRNVARIPHFGSGYRDQAPDVVIGFAY